VLLLICKEAAAHLSQRPVRVLYTEKFVNSHYLNMGGLLAHDALLHSRNTTWMQSVRRFPYRTNAYYTMAVRCNNDLSKLDAREVVSFKDLLRCFGLILASKM
jgi:hypothetical protein